MNLIDILDLPGAQSQRVHQILSEISKSNRPSPSKCKGNGNGERTFKEICQNRAAFVAQKHGIKGTVCTLSGAYPDRIFSAYYSVAKTIHCYENRPSTYKHIKPFFDKQVKPKLDIYIPIYLHKLDLLDDTRECDILDYDTDITGSDLLYDKVIKRCHVAMPNKGIMLLNVWVSRGRENSDEEHYSSLDYLEKELGKIFGVMECATTPYEDSYPMSWTYFVLERK